MIILSATTHTLKNIIIHCSRARSSFYRENHSYQKPSARVTSKDMQREDGVEEKMLKFVLSNS